MARVIVDVALAHLDRPFDYAVPDELAEAARPGVRVRVRFAGRLVDGWLLERVAASEHVGRLSPLSRVVSAEPVLTPVVLGLARAVAERYAGSLADVLRLAIPPRHARAERAVALETVRQVTPVPADPPAAGPWSGYPGGAGLLAGLSQGRPVRAVWAAAPGEDWPAALAAAVLTSAAAGRGALVVLPDQRDVQRVLAAITAAQPGVPVVTLTAQLGPETRYRRWLSLLRGQARIAVGTRAAAFAPVPDLGLAVVWDDGDDLHAESRAPYPHVREVLALRAHLGRHALLVAGHAVTAEAQQLVASGWATALAARREVTRARGPRVQALATGAAGEQGRLPSTAWRVVRDALREGPVLIQVPRSGYLPALACRRCRSVAHCPDCQGPLGLPAGARAATCRLCARVHPGFACPHCGEQQLRAVVVGSSRTPEELGRAFPGVPVRSSGGAGVLGTVADRPAIVVATPGAEPVAERGYAAALLLDGWALLGRADLRAGEEALRRWMAAATLVRPGAQGGSVVLVAEPGHRAVQALLRWDPGWHAARELADRVAARLPPATRLAEVTGAGADVAELVSLAELPGTAEVLGPAPLGGSDPSRGQVRVIVRVPRQDGTALAAALHAAVGVRSARKIGGPTRVRIDPVVLG